MPLAASEVVGLAEQRGLEVQFELGKKHGGAFEARFIEELIDQGKRWMDAGAVEVIVEARESAKGVGLFDDVGNVDRAFADRFASAFGLSRVTFEALLGLEIYPRSLYLDAFSQRSPKPAPPTRNAA